MSDSSIGVALIVNHFPLPSQTFIVRLVEALVADPGFDCRVVIMKSRRPFESMVRPEHAEAVAASLSEAPRIRGGGPLRLLSALGLAAGCFARAPVFTLRALNVFRFGRRALRLHVLRLAWVLRSLPEMDALHGQFLWFAGDLAACSRLGVTGRARLFAAVRGADARDRSESRPGDLRRAAAAGVFLTPVSQSLAAVMQQQGYDPKLITVVPSGLPIDEFPYLAPSGRATEERLRLLFVGRLTPKKGLDLAVRALAELVDAGQPCRLTVVGDGPERAPAGALARQLGIEELVHFTGALSSADILTQLHAHGIVVVPSVGDPDGNLEGIPNVAKEAMAAGTIVVASDHSGLPELITDGQTGFLFPEGDAAALAAAVRRALSERRRWDEIAAAARKFVQQNHSIEAMLERLRKLYAGEPAHSETASNGTLI